MADRTVNGNTHTENGWRLVDQGSCVWVKVPGTNVTMQIREGQPAKIMGAFAADFNANVESLRDADSACYTESNSVLGTPGKNNGSNHMSATAMDLNWNGPDGKTFRLGITEERAYPGDKARNLRELLDFYEGMIFCGGAWSIRDWMHFQMGGATAGPKNFAKVEDFIRRKIRADGFSTYKRDAAPPPAPSSYGMPTGTRINYGQPGFPDWVYQLAGRFNLRASTYPGHQENNRNEAGFAPNPQHLNRGIDWAGPVADMQRLADYCLSIRHALEQVIWQNPNTGQRVGVAGGKDVSASSYYASDYGGHRDHVHTRQSAPIPIPGEPPPPPPPPPAVNAADVLARAAGISPAKAQEILPQVSFALVKANCTNPRRIAAALAQWIIESGHFVYTEEIDDGPESEERWKYKGRTWVQLTWLENYKGFSEWCHSLGLVPTPDYFVVRPRELAEQKWAALGPAYWWAVKYPRINEYADRGDIDNVSKWVNAPAWVDNPNKHANHEAERRAAYNKALALGDQLLALTTSAPQEEGFLMALSDQQQREIYDTVCGQRPSNSPFRSLGQGNIGNMRDVIGNIDGSVHVQIVEFLASLGHPDFLGLLREIAAADPVRYPDRQSDRLLAQAVLAKVAAPQQMDPQPARAAVAVVNGTNGSARELADVHAELAALRQATDRLIAERTPEPTAELVTVNGVEPSTGEVIGELYTALEKLRLADALPIESRAPLAALISVLSTKNGATI